MICSSCGTENPGGRQVLHRCASPLAVMCRTCGTANVPAARFCAECATPLAGADRSRARRPPRDAAPRPWPSDVSSACCSPIWSGSPRCRGPRRRGRRELLSRYFEPLARSSSVTAARWRSSSATRSWRSGARRSRTRTTPSAPSGRRSSWSTPCPASDPGSGRAPGCSPARRPPPRATRQGIVAGDLVNTAAGSSRAPPGTVLVGEATHGRRPGRSPSSQPAIRR